MGGKHGLLVFLFCHIGFQLFEHSDHQLSYSKVHVDVELPVVSMDDVRTIHRTKTLSNCIIFLALSSANSILSLRWVSLPLSKPCQGGLLTNSDLTYQLLWWEPHNLGSVYDIFSNTKNKRLLFLLPKILSTSKTPITLLKIVYMEDVEYDRLREVTAFDETKTGVKGLADSGITKIPQFFRHGFQVETLGILSSTPAVSARLQVPLIDFGGFGGEGHGKIVETVRQASEAWGFFQIVNHGVPLYIMKDMLDGVRRFHEQPSDVRKMFYSRDPQRSVKYYCNGDLLTSKVSDWRDSVFYNYPDSLLDPEEIPFICREAVTDYMKHIFQLRRKLCRVLSEALGLDQDYLTAMECFNTVNLVCHYYPPCPQPELTLGATKHSDPSFMTVLMQDDVGGLQVIHQSRWVDVPSSLAALVVNIGDMMQLITNGKFRSVEHRVLVGRTGPRVSAACFFYPSMEKKYEPYRPVKELLSPNEEPVYREVSAGEYLVYYKISRTDGKSSLSHFKII